MNSHNFMMREQQYKNLGIDIDPDRRVSHDRHILQPRYSNMVERGYIKDQYTAITFTNSQCTVYPDKKGILEVGILYDTGNQIVEISVLIRNSSDTAADTIWSIAGSSKLDSFAFLLKLSEMCRICEYMSCSADIDDMHIECKIHFGIVVVRIGFSDIDAKITLSRSDAIKLAAIMQYELYTMTHRR